LKMCHWSLASPARLLLESEIEIGRWLINAVNRSSQKWAAVGASRD
jgi:hypothetical protein